MYDIIFSKEKSINLYFCIKCIV